MPKDKQHYVPQFLLKRFATGKKGNPKIFVYDKSNNNEFLANVKNVAAEGSFYDLEVDDYILTLEKGLSHLESNTSPVIKEILKKKTLKVLNDEKIAILAVFLAVQFVRTKEYRLKFQHAKEQLIHKLKSMNIPEDVINKQLNNPNNVDENKLIGIDSIIRIEKIVPHFLDKTWLLFETTNKHPFYISDNPLTLHNDINHKPYGNLGLTAQGIQIYLPISTTMCLALFCPSITEQFIKAHDNIAVSLFKKDNTNGMRDFYNGIVHRSPIQTVEENVVMMNSLQVISSSRFVYCEKKSFSLVEGMISDNKKFRKGRKMEVV